MKYTYIFAIVLALVVVSMAAKNTDKAAKKAARQAAKELKKKCKPVSLSYSECKDNKMTITKNPPAGVTGCTPITAEVQCIATSTKTKGTCTRTKTIDYTACGVPGANLDTAMKTISVTYAGCSKNIPPRTKQFACSGFKGAKKGKADKGQKDKGGKKMKKERRLRNSKDATQ